MRVTTNESLHLTKARNARRGELAASHTALTLVGWNAVPPKGDVPKLVHIVYRVEREEGPGELALWIEEASGHYLLNTIAIGPPSAGSAR